MAQHRRGESRPIRWLACNTIAQGADVACNLRLCRGCGAQVLVALWMCALVDSGELRTRCWRCAAKAGGAVQLHDVDAARLAALGQLDQAHAVIAEINEWLDELRAEIGQESG